MTGEDAFSLGQDHPGAGTMMTSPPIPMTPLSAPSGNPGKIHGMAPVMFMPRFPERIE